MATASEISTELYESVKNIMVKRSSDVETVKVTSLAFTGESIAIIDKIVHGKFKISAATHEYCKCFDGFVA